MIESTGRFIARKIREAGSVVYRSVIFPFVRMRIERKTDSIIAKGAYLFNGTTLEGQDYINEGAVLGNVRVGHHTYINPGSSISDARIGNYSCIMVRIAYGRHPVKGENISIHPAFFSSAAQYGYTYVDEDSFTELEYADKENGYKIVIGSDVWIGVECIVADGVTIGDGAVVGARSLVLTDIEPYAIYAGTPAKKIGTRFDEETVKKLLELRWWDKDEAWIKENARLFKNPGEFLITNS